MYYIINKANGYIAESIESKYLALVSNDKAKEVLAKYTELWDKIKNQIKKYMIKQVNIEKTPWKLSLIQMIIYLWIKQ